MPNPIREVHDKYQQSIWYDNIRRGLITSGELQRMVTEDGLMGLTSNPAIFQKALAGSTDYDDEARALIKEKLDAMSIYERLAGKDIQDAADILRPVYDQTKMRDGYASFEVSPYKAHDTRATIEEARRLHAALNRPNVLIKVPATPEGIPAIQQLISEGISVNVTLLFSVEAYEQVAWAYIAGLEAALKAGKELARIASVASFFISRIDTLVDERLEKLLDQTRDNDRRAKLKSLVGKIAIANAKIAYEKYLDIIATDRWKALAAKGAQTQRLLWASTSTKNPKYPRTLYVDELIGPDTVNTVPEETYHAFKQEGVVRPRLTENWAENLESAKEKLRTLAEVGISMKEVTDTLLDEAVKKFCDPFDQLLAAVERKRQVTLGQELAKLTAELGEYAPAIKAALEDWRASGKVRRLWAGDTSLWSGKDENQWLGWLHIVDMQQEQAAQFKNVLDDAKAAGFKHAVVLGMGGSSLCPEVMRETFGVIPGCPELHVLDSTVPAQVKTLEKKLDIARTLFIVSSKSGSTTEPNVFKQYFFDKVSKTIGADKAGTHFAAITDPGTKMHQIAKNDRFRHIFFGVPSIGGRFSALSNFGMIPSAILGVNVPDFLSRTELMVQSCSSCVPPELNPGVVLGVIMGTLAKAGRDKVTVIASPGIGSLGLWLEQLMAESTGKEGKGLIPIAGEKLGAPSAYGKDRLFVYVRLENGASPEQDAAMQALEKAGQPVVRIALADRMDLGQEFFRWEIATAVAGSILGINAFNQPDVEAAKVAARRLTGQYEETGKLPPESPILKDGSISIFADAGGPPALGNPKSLDEAVKAHLGRIKPGDYFAICAYIEMNGEHDVELQTLRLCVRDKKQVATTLGYGPRFLHSTGQLHKGGPNTGVFLQITSDDAEDLPIPDQKYTFGVLKRAQAQGDMEVLCERKRRVLRVHLGADVKSDLKRLREAIQKALA